MPLSAYIFMPGGYLNYRALLVSVVLSFLVGFLWYSPLLFGKPWMKLMGIDKNDKEKIAKMKKQAGPAYLISIIGTFVTAFVLAHFVSYSFIAYTYDYDIPAVWVGLATAFWIWLGFVVPVMLTEVLFGGKPFKLWLINAGYQLVSLLIAGALLATWV